MIPIDEGDPTGVVGKIESTQRGDVGVARWSSFFFHAAIQEDTVAFSSAERSALAQHGVERVPSGYVLTQFGFVFVIDR